MRYIKRGLLTTPQLPKGFIQVSADQSSKIVECVFCQEKKPLSNLITGFADQHGRPTFLCRTHMEGRWHFQWVKSLNRTKATLRNHNGYTGCSAKF